MQPINNDSSQSWRSAFNSTKFLDPDYVGLTLKEFHSSANGNQKEAALHLMLNSDMSKVPCLSEKLSHKNVEHHELQLQGGRQHLSQEQHHAQQQVLVDSTRPSLEQLAAAVRYSTPLNSDQLLDWKDSESINGDCGIPISWMNDILLGNHMHEIYKEAEARVQNRTLPGEVQTSTGTLVPNTSRRSHVWLQDGFEDSMARPCTDQSGLSDLLQRPLHSSGLPSKLFGDFDRPQSTPSQSGCSDPRDYDMDFCTRATSSSRFEFEDEYQIPPSHSTRGNLLRSNSAPLEEGLIPHENLLTRQASMSVQLNFGGQGTQATSSDSVQGLSFLERVSNDLPDHMQENASRFFGSVNLTKARLDSDMQVHVDMTGGCRNMSLDSLPTDATIKLPPLDLETVLGTAAADVPNLHHINNADGHGKSSKPYLTSANPTTTPSLSITDLPSLLRLNSTPEPSSLIDLTHATKNDKVEPESFLMHRKRRIAPRRSRFDPHDTPCTFVTERIRREKLTEKYNILKSLIPKSTKVDRASIIEETIGHVQSLKSEIIQLEKVKQEKLKNIKRQKLEAAEDHDGLVFEQSGDVKCQWLRKTSRHGTEVDIRILDDELLVSIVQKHLPRFLLRMVTALETKLKLDILNATGSVIDGHDVYNFKVKITGNSCAAAGEIMTKILETLDSVF